MTTTDSRLVYRLVLAVDVERYTRRNAWEQLRIQRDLRSALELAATRSALDRNHWHRQPRGDGELAVLPEEADIPNTVGAFTGGLEAALTELNRGRPEGARLRLRLAFHYGTLVWGPFGPAGDAPVVVSRLLDAAPLRQLLARRRDRDLALIVSASLYEDVVSTGFCPLDAAGFEPIRISVKGIAYRGLIYSAPEGVHEPFAPQVEDTRDTSILPFSTPRRSEAFGHAVEHSTHSHRAASS